MNFKPAPRPIDKRQEFPLVIQNETGVDIEYCVDHPLKSSVKELNKNQSKDWLKLNSVCAPLTEIPNSEINDCFINIRTSATPNNSHVLYIEALSLAGSSLKLSQYLVAHVVSQTDASGVIKVRSSYQLSNKTDISIIKVAPAEKEILQEFQHTIGPGESVVIPLYLVTPKLGTIYLRPVHSTHWGRLIHSSPMLFPLRQMNLGTV